MRRNTTSLLPASLFIEGLRRFVPQSHYGNESARKRIRVTAVSVADVADDRDATETPSLIFFLFFSRLLVLTVGLLSIPGGPTCFIVAGWGLGDVSSRFCDFGLGCRFGAVV